MSNLLKFGGIVFFVSVMLLSHGPSYCEEAYQNVQTYSGQVMEIDWVGSLLTVQGGDEMTFYVPSGTKVYQGTETISFEDLDQDDYVIIKYVDMPSGRPKALSITLDKAYPSF